ncbi:hypothetical protein EGT07_23835 [Herbaspirillum sp. HC18]|nr:hypothetical protein EGT07_23835 [Herbaspirillum sp. HC18]
MYILILTLFVTVPTSPTVAVTHQPTMMTAEYHDAHSCSDAAKRWLKDMAALFGNGAKASALCTEKMTSRDR